MFHHNQHHRFVAAAIPLVVMAGLLAGCTGGSTTPDGSSAPSDAALADLLPDSIREAGVVRVATDIPFPPYEYTDEDGNITGFEYDLAQAVGGLLGVEFEFQKQPFDGIIPGLAAGKYDIVWSSVTDTREREKVVDFVDYAVSQGGILVKKGSDISGKDDLCGRKVSTLTGSTGIQDIEDQSAKCVADGKDPIEPVVFPSDTAAQLAIQSGTVEASLNDAASLAYIAQTVGDGDAFEVIVYTDEENPRFPLGVAVPKESSELRDAIQAALQSLVDSGEYLDILETYGVGALAVDTVTVNEAIN